MQAAEELGPTLATVGPNLITNLKPKKENKNSLF